MQIALIFSLVIFLITLPSGHKCTLPTCKFQTNSFIHSVKLIYHHIIISTMGDLQNLKTLTLNNDKQFEQPFGCKQKLSEINRIHCWSFYNGVQKTEIAFCFWNYFFKLFFSVLIWKSQEIEDKGKIRRKKRNWKKKRNLKRGGSRFLHTVDVFSVSHKHHYHSTVLYKLSK